MDFCANAGEPFVGMSCDICDREIEAGQAVRHDIDGDATGVKVRARCACCHDKAIEIARAALMVAEGIARCSSSAAVAADSILLHARLHGHEVAA